ncbi:MAG TPA: LytTR family DNA-binding domain-containing protein [Bacteroidia bacterium]|nr:LytTR family DNA-binding domain-containing protein [Bacteroidia bacterium]
MKTQEFKAVIVDDEADGREITALLLSALFPCIEIIDKCGSVSAGARSIATHAPDLIFLDVKMGDGSGFDLLKRLPNTQPLVIFITAYDNFAIKAIKTSAFDYILKPIDEDEFRDTVNKAIGRLESRGLEKRNSVSKLDVKKVGLPNLTGFSFVDAQSIVRCEADGHYTTIYFANSPKMVVTKILSHFEDELTRFGFFRVHNKHLVNLNFIKSYSKGKGGRYITMADGSDLEVATRKKGELLKVISLGEF